MQGNNLPCDEGYRMHLDAPKMLYIGAKMILYEFLSHIFFYVPHKKVIQD